MIGDFVVRGDLVTLDDDRDYVVTDIPEFDDLIIVSWHDGNKQKYRTVMRSQVVMRTEGWITDSEIDTLDT